MGIALTIPACRPKYMLARHTPEPRIIAHAIDLVFNESPTEERCGMGRSMTRDAVELSAIVC